MINNYREEDKDKVIELWNRAAVKIGYKEMDSKRFSDIFTKNPYFDPKLTFVMKEEAAVTGFACGCVGNDLPLGDTSGYVTCIILDEQYETEENYRKLMDCIEEAFIKAGKLQSEILFFNPMMLPWYIKGTDHHEHNNAPGVFKNSRLFRELLNYGYTQRTTECAMYLKLDHFMIPQKVQEKERKAELEGFEVSLFDKNRHRELDTMLPKLDNPLWEKEINQAAKEGKPFLAAA